MKIFVDENIPALTVERLREAGHDVLDIRGTSRQGLADDELWTLAQTERCVLVTTDKGFTRFRDETHFGMLVIRLRQPNVQRIHTRILAAFRRYADAEWPGRLVVMRDLVQSVYRS